MYPNNKKYPQSYDNKIPNENQTYNHYNEYQHQSNRQEYQNIKPENTVQSYNKYHQQPEFQNLNTSNSQPQYSIDYLNQIAAKPPVQQISTKAKILLWTMIGSIVIIAFIIFNSLLYSDKNNNLNISGLEIEISVTQKIAIDAHKNIKSSKLRSANSQLNTTLSGSIQKLDTYLATNQIEKTPISDSLIDSAMDKELIDKLEKARLNGIFDRTYTNEIIHKIGLIEISIQQLSKTSDETANKELQKITSDLEVMKKQFIEISSSGL